MEIQKGIQIEDLGLFIKKDKILILGDLHIGQEEAMNKEGMLIPRFQHKDLILKTKKILEKTKPSLIILNGDIKHEFSGISREEWKKVQEYLDLISKNAKIIIIKGNHDNILEPIASKKGLVVQDYYIHDKIIITHGDKLLDEGQQTKNTRALAKASANKINKTESSDVDAQSEWRASTPYEDFKKSKIIIIGHEHPSIGLQEGNRVEKYKCFLKGKYKDKTLIVMPSMNQLTEGTDVLTERLLSPYLKEKNSHTNINSFETWIVEGNEVFYFGKLKGLRK